MERASDLRERRHDRRITCVVLDPGISLLERVGHRRTLCCKRGSGVEKGGSGKQREVGEWSSEALRQRQKDGRQMFRFPLSSPVWRGTVAMTHSDLVGFVNLKIRVENPLDFSRNMSWTD